MKSPPPTPDHERGAGAAALLGVGADDNLDESVSTSRRQWIQNLRFGCPCGALDTVHGLPSGGSGDLNTEREFPSDKVYRRDDCGIVGFQPFGADRFAFDVIHTNVGRAASRYGSAHQ
jgi:hypothetical protein